MKTVYPSVEITDFEQMCCEQVVALLKSKSRELEVLYWLVAGLNPQEVAKKLGISVKTVDCYKTSILAECRNIWAIPSNEKITYRFLQKKFTKAEQALKESMQTMVEGEYGQARELTIQDRAYCEQVRARASKSERKVLDAFADGLDPQDVADRLERSPKTIHSHKTKLLALCRSVWNLSRNERLDYHFLNEKFKGFSAMRNGKDLG